MGTRGRQPFASLFEDHRRSGALTIIDVELTIRLMKSHIAECVDSQRCDAPTIHPDVCVPIELLGWIGAGDRHRAGQLWCCQ